MCNREKVIVEIKRCLSIAEATFNREFRMPTVRYDKRGTTAGTANHTKWEINLNETLLNENGDTFINRTVPHEIAHLIDGVVYKSNVSQGFDRRGRRKPRSVHGKNWKNIMAIFGVTDITRCHSYDVTNSKQGTRTTTKYDYLCTGCNQVLKMGATRHKRHSSGRTTYSHCRGNKLIYMK